ncbi:hypothetical protein BJ165DRAFT_1530781 [Panaeolus papilionaceus]|nr:hypothetical protein BJ165DRAFT_1530781 [Panaeolus papilionaceus]
MEADRVAESDFDESAAYSPETEPDGNRMAHRLQFDVEDTLTQRNTKSAGIAAVYAVLLHPDEVRPMQCRRRNSAVHHCIKRIPTTRLAKCNSYCVDHILAERPDVVVEQVRQLIATHQLNNEPLRILLASLASDLKLTNSFITSTLQKHFFREMKLSDTSMKNP